jgi:hypothetical protein
MPGPLKAGHRSSKIVSVEVFLFGYERDGSFAGLDLSVIPRAVALRRQDIGTRPPFMSSMDRLSEPTISYRCTSIPAIFS